MISLRTYGRAGRRSARSRGAFTIIEMLVGTTILIMIMVIISSVMNHTSATVKLASTKLDAFQSARAAFDTIGQKLSQATLNTYWDYDNPAAPTRFVRKSDMHFLSLTPRDYPAELSAPAGTTHGLFFETPEAMSANSSYDQCLGLLNACGYYVEFGSDLNTAPKWTRPAHSQAPQRYRYRLMQAIQPAESLSVFTGSGATSAAWAGDLAGQAWPLADNVIALIAQPRLSVGDSGTALTTDYFYDSRSTSKAIQKAQLPPIVQLTMIVIDESSALRLQNGITPPSVIQNALQSRFLDVSQYQADLDFVTRELAKNRIRYQVFTSSVLLRESKWSSTP